MPSVSREELAKLKVADLRAKAAELSIDPAGLKKAELVEAVFDASVKAEGFNEVAGVLDILADGYGFLRTQGYLPSETDAYVGLSTIRRNGLRKGDYVSGQTRPARENEKYAAIQKVLSVNGVPIEQCGNRPRFADLTPVYPDERLWMEHGKQTVTARVIDLVGAHRQGPARPHRLARRRPARRPSSRTSRPPSRVEQPRGAPHVPCSWTSAPKRSPTCSAPSHGEVISSTFDMPCREPHRPSPSWSSSVPSAWWSWARTSSSCSTPSRASRAPTTWRQPGQSGRILSGGVDSTALYPPKTLPRALPATSRAAAA